LLGSLVHDNGVNVLQVTPPAGGKVNSSYPFFIQDWIYNSNYSLARTSPGIRITGPQPGTQALTYVSDCVLGPCLLRGINCEVPNGSVDMSDVLLLDATAANIRANTQSCSLFRVTSFMTPHNALGTGHNCINLINGAQVYSSIVYGGCVAVPSGVTISAPNDPNDQFRTTCNTTALNPKEIDPGFKTNVSNLDGAVPPSVLDAADFTPTTSIAPGSSLTSVGQLLKQIFP